jgi:hypothetical protein
MALMSVSRAVVVVGEQTRPSQTPLLEPQPASGRRLLALSFCWTSVKLLYLHHNLGGGIVKRCGWGLLDHAVSFSSFFLLPSTSSP